tara:strand:- start:1758 stop:2240 length:483 start_codon:yes stop_codon:yes gene_type:complete
MTVEKVLDNEFDLLMKDIQAAYLSKGMKATGKTSESIENTSSLNVGRLIADENIEALEKGRSPTGSSSSGQVKLIDVIKQWIIDKGIVSDIKNDINNSALAFLITRKIHREGWKRKDHGGINLISDVVTNKRIQMIINKVGEAATITIVKKIENELKTIK